MWTFGRGEHEKQSHYGLLNQNLVDLEKDGRIVIKKLQEMFKVHYL